MDDVMIIELYFRRDGDAIVESEKKYGGYCYQVAYNILRRHEDSEECVNDTWMKTWNTIPPEKPSCLKLFLAKITRNLSLDRYRKNTAQKRGGVGVGAGSGRDSDGENHDGGAHSDAEYADEILGELGECVAAGFSPNSASEFSSVEDEVLSAELGKVINKFLLDLPERDRYVFLMRYFYGKNMREIAEKYALREDNVRKILFRTRQKLRQHLEKEGYSV